MRKVALKYCGGCNPAFDRVAYFNEIKSAARGLIDWVRSDDEEGFQALLIINGCNTACPERDLTCGQGVRVLSLRNNEMEPDRVVEILLE
ncbi:MAG: hypothetical protein JW950_08080 [Deltaproteobacteria bacterium]|nr:hypothetical protein [Deltaproteobacteria bacterium]